ncbi:hypothetical protein ACQUHS_00240, partial [Pseudomonas aeruginosa]|uniref:hypothetical protein n=1 Tax=Pseudomonas aeruginosa TaxID=287 RepID=UPI003FD5F31A
MRASLARDARQVKPVDGKKAPGGTRDETAFTKRTLGSLHVGRITPTALSADTPPQRRITAMRLFA